MSHIPEMKVPRGAGFSMCPVCHQAYPLRGYSLHKMQPWHIDHLKASEERARVVARKKAHKDRRELCVAARRAGMTLGDIGNMLGVSRQRIYQVLVQEGAHVPRDRGNRTRTCFIDGQEFRWWKEHSEGVAHKTAESVIVGHLKNSPRTKNRENNE